MITLSRLINSLDGEEELEQIADPILEKLNTLEAFDYTINEYHLPPMAGDIFTNSKNQQFILIGQDCDMARRGDGISPKNAIAELLEAKTCPKNNCKKWAKDLEKVSICIFRKTKESVSEILQIYYQKRQYISNEILNLCCFNADGQCYLPKTELLDRESSKLLPKHISEYYTELQSYYKLVTNLKKELSADLENIVEHAFSPRLIVVLKRH